MKLDRTLQRMILETPRQSYPRSVDISALWPGDSDHVQGNLFYLEEHGLVDGSDAVGHDSPFVLARITAGGLGFLEDDGVLGLSNRLHHHLDSSGLSTTTRPFVLVRCIAATGY